MKDVSGDIYINT